MVDWLAGFSPAGLLCVSLALTPVPAARPRVSRNGGVYYPASYSNFLAECKQIIATQAPTKLDGDLVVLVESVTRRPATSKLSAPIGDVDNLCKGPLDAAKELLWRDDRQIVSLTTTKRWAKPGETPHVNLYYGKIT